MITFKYTYSKAQMCNSVGKDFFNLDQRFAVKKTSGYFWRVKLNVDTTVS